MSRLAALLLLLPIAAIAQITDPLSPQAQPTLPVNCSFGAVWMPESKAYWYPSQQVTYEWLPASGAYRQTGIMWSRDAAILAGQNVEMWTLILSLRASLGATWNPAAVPTLTQAQWDVIRGLKAQADTIKARIDKLQALP